MKDYKVPINRTSWLLQDLVISPSLAVVVWFVLVEFFPLTIINFLIQKFPFLNSSINATSDIPILRTNFANVYFLHYPGILAFVVFVVMMLISFNPVIPGPARQLYLPFRRWRVNKIVVSAGMRKLDLPENPFFPPPFNPEDEVALAGIKQVQENPSLVLLGYRKRFSEDLSLEHRAGENPEKRTEYEPFLISRKARLRHTSLVGGSGSGKTAGPLAKTLEADNSSVDMATVTINPKIDTYLLTVAASPIMKWRKEPEYLALKDQFDKAVSEGETRNFAQWMRSNKSSSKPFGFLSMSRNSLTIGWNPLEHGDADIITKKIIYSAENIGGSVFYAAEQESWLLKLMRLYRSDRDLDGRLSLWHISWFALDPKNRLQKAVGPIVQVTPEVKFPELKTKIEATRRHDDLISQGKPGLEEGVLLTAEERAKILRHEDNQILLENLKQVQKENLSALVSHISQLVEDETISPIFTDHTLPQLDIREIIRNAGAIYVEVQSQAKPPQARALARMVLMELQIYSSERETGKESSEIQVQVNLDEFASLTYEEFINFLDKARSSRIGFMLAHQSMGNLQRKHLGEAFGAEIGDNTGTKIYLSVNDPHTRNHFREVIGEVKTLRESVTESESKSSGVGVGNLGVSGSSSSGVSSQHSEAKEFVVMSRDFASPLGFGIVQLLEEDGRSWRGSVSLDHISPTDKRFPSPEEVANFLSQEKLDFPCRRLPYYSVDTQGRLVDRFLGTTVSAAHCLKVQRKLNGELPQESTTGSEPIKRKTKQATPPQEDKGKAPTPSPQVPAQVQEPEVKVEAEASPSPDLVGQVTPESPVQNQSLEDPDTTKAGVSGSPGTPSEVAKEVNPEDQNVGSRPIDRTAEPTIDELKSWLGEP